MFRDMGRTWVAALVVVLGVMALAAIVIVIGTFAGGWFQESTANFRGKVGVANATKANTAFRIQAYDHFFDLCAAVQDDEASLDSLDQELATSKPSQSRLDQINASKTALRGSRAEKINQYNVDAKKDWTIGQFRSNGLPFQLNKTKEETTCSA
jgi:hypothetical protein